jgi:hypothetical protein
VVINRLRPPTPDMQGRELVQWLQRVYDVLLEYQTTPPPEPPEVPSSHDQLTENGGTGSHAVITSHIAALAAHGRSSDLVGVVDVQVLANKVIDALNNTITNLRHGVEVDNPTAAHGVAQVIGASEAAVLANKDIRRIVKLHTGGNYTALITDDTIIAYTSSTIALPIPTASDIGKVFTLTNASTSASMTILGSGRPINGETSQILPPGSSATIVFDSFAWRIV